MIVARRTVRAALFGPDYSLPWFMVRFCSIRDCVFVRIDPPPQAAGIGVLLRALGFTEQILESFYTNNVFHVKAENMLSLELAAHRLRGEIAAFDIKDEKGKVIVEQGRRITARHINQIEKSGVCRAQYRRTTCSVALRPRHPCIRRYCGDYCRVQYRTD